MLAQDIQRDAVKIDIRIFGMPGSAFLGSPRRGRSQMPGAEQPFVEILHEPRGRLVVDLPQCGGNPRSAGMHKAARQSDHSFAPNLLAQSRLASAEDNQIGIPAEIVDVV